MATSFAGHHGEALEGVGNAHIGDTSGTAHQSIVGVALGLLRLTLCDRHAGA